MVKGGRDVEAAFAVVDRAQAAGLVMGENAELPAERAELAIRANNLTRSAAPRPLTPQSLVPLMGRHGCALFVILSPGATITPSRGHVYALTGLRGDGTAAGTTLTIHDPFRTGLATASLQTFTTMTISSIVHIAH